MVVVRVLQEPNPWCSDAIIYVVVCKNGSTSDGGRENKGICFVYVMAVLRVAAGYKTLL